MRAPLRVGILVAVLAGSGCAPAPGEPVRDLLHRAEEVLVRDCMARQGFTYEPRPRTPAPDVERFPYVVDDPEWARANGYGRAQRRALEQEASSAARSYGELPEQRQKAWLAAYHGDRASGLAARLPFGGTVGHSDRGCTAQAWQDLYGDMRAWFRVSRITDALDQMRIGQTLRDRRYVAAKKRWQECMSAEGFAAEAPLTFRTRQLEYQGADEEARDRAAATAEATCAARSELSAVARQLDAANASALEKKYQAEYDTADRLRHAALPKARDVLARSTDHLVSR